jgi:hypothetical protein
MSSNVSSSSVDAGIVLPEWDDRLRSVLLNCERAESVSSKEISLKESEGDSQKLMPAATKRARPDFAKIGTCKPHPPFGTYIVTICCQKRNKEVHHIAVP